MTLATYPMRTELIDYYYPHPMRPLTVTEGKPSMVSHNITSRHEQNCRILELFGLDHFGIFCLPEPNLRSHPNERGITSLPTHKAFSEETA